MRVGSEKDKALVDQYLVNAERYIVVFREREEGDWKLPINMS